MAGGRPRIMRESNVGNWVAANYQSTFTGLTKIFGAPPCTLPVCLISLDILRFLVLDVEMLQYRLCALAYNICVTKFRSNGRSRSHAARRVSKYRIATPSFALSWVLAHRLAVCIKSKRRGGGRSESIDFSNGNDEDCTTESYDSVQ
jgi:hypothetical protein